MFTCVECTILQRRPQRIIFLLINIIIVGPQSLLFFLLPIFLRNHCLQTKPLRRGGQYAELAKYPSHPIGRLGADRYPISQSIRLETDFLNPSAGRDWVVRPDLYFQGQAKAKMRFFSYRGCEKGVRRVCSFPACARNEQVVCCTGDDTGRRRPGHTHYFEEFTISWSPSVGGHHPVERRVLPSETLEAEANHHDDRNIRSDRDRHSPLLAATRQSNKKRKRNTQPKSTVRPHFPAKS